MRALLVLSLLAACGGGSAGSDAGAIDAAATVDAAAIDAVPATDAPPADAPPVYGVPCGDSMEPCVPATSQGCCDTDGDAGCAPNFGLCLGDLKSCDGREDCSVATTCCSFGTSPSCADPNDCVPDLGGTVLCHYASECPIWALYCCGGACSPDRCPDAGL